MKNKISYFLNEYTTDIETINKLIVSAFLYSRNTVHVKNKMINALIIRKGDENFHELELFISKFHIDTLEKVIEAFEYVISPEEKIVSGAVYTPAIIREFIIDEILSNTDNIDNVTICDPACGCSGFLISAVNKFRIFGQKNYKEIIEENVFGLDIKGYAIERSKILLTLLAIDNGEDHEIINFNLFEGNALSKNWNDHINGFDGFDVVVGNPPYVCSRNIDNESKGLLGNWKVSSTGHPDLYIPFFEIGMSILKESGKLGYITMNSFYKSLNGRALRDYFSTESYKFNIIDFGSNQIFPSNNTYTCICILQKKKSKEIRFCSAHQNKLSNIKYLNIPYSSLDDFNGWNLKEPSIVNRIESIGKPFSSIFRTSSGIATLKNDVYIFDPVFEDDYFLYIDKYTPIEKSICREILNTNKLTKVSNLSSIKKKIIFPYEHSNGTALAMPEKYLSSKFPMAYKYLLTKKKVLSTRDKGKGNYPEWFSYGRNQSLEKYKYKLLFPHIAPRSPNFLISTDEDLLFHNGLSLLDNDLSKIKLAQKIMSSRIFWFYIENTSKPYGSGYMSLSKNYIKSFGVYDFTEEEKKWLIEERNQYKINNFLEKKYGVSI